MSNFVEIRPDRFINMSLIEDIIISEQNNEVSIGFYFTNSDNWIYVDSAFERKFTSKEDANNWIKNYVLKGDKKWQE